MAWNSYSNWVKMCTGAHQPDGIYGEQNVTD